MFESKKRISPGTWDLQPQLAIFAYHALCGILAANRTG
jgi:hypothetical protein